MFKTFLLIFLLGAVLLNGKPQRNRRTHYDMNCDCGQRADDEEARNEREKSVKTGERVIGGCKAGYIPWFRGAVELSSTRLEIKLRLEN